MYDMNVLERHLYKEALDSASSFNTRLLVERQSRLPFLDTQTNIAQVYTLFHLFIIYYSIYNII